MRKIQCIVMLIALYGGSAQSFSWDFATASGNDLEFYLNGTKTHSENITRGGISKMTYDPVGNRLFFFYEGYTDDFILSFDLTTKKIESVVPRLDNERIESIAFDPVEKILFYNVYYHGIIYWTSLKSGFDHNAYGNFLAKTSLYGTSTIAIDSCRGYIYWTMNYATKKLPSAIERARFDGSEKEVVIGTGLRSPQCLVIDHQTQKLYWTDGTVKNYDNLGEMDGHFTIESADLNGKNRRVLYRETGHHQPMSLAVSEDSIYWSYLWLWNTWQLPKNPSTQAKPKEIPIRPWDAIVTNYKIEQQLQGVHNCARLKSVLQNNSWTEENESLDVSSNISVHDFTVCQNYCFQGECSVNDEGQPQCRCNGDFSGVRCEVNVCQGYCLNDGVCFLTEENQPVCQCRADYEGKRCEVSTCLNRLYKHFQTVAMLGAVLNADVAQGTPDRAVKSTCAATVV